MPKSLRAHVSDTITVGGRLSFASGRHLRSSQREGRPRSGNLPPARERSSPVVRPPAAEEPTTGLAKFRVGAEGGISHLKRRFGLARRRLKGYTGAQTWAAFAVLASNLTRLAALAG